MHKIVRALAIGTILGNMSGMYAGQTQTLQKKSNAQPVGTDKKQQLLSMFAKSQEDKQLAVSPGSPLPLVGVAPSKIQDLSGFTEPEEKDRDWFGNDLNELFNDTAKK
jgi:hypothetical protein